ncbi:MAG: RHS repeat-associated core domain-containing protein [Bacteroidota bacterium]|nr:RHS repeat-associated core domain-containing protein [Bacteroidota bacterium]
MVVTWDPQVFKGVTHYDVEWAWVDINDLDRYKDGSGNFVPDLIFKRNSTRVTIDASNSSYRVPLIYDGSGNLFFRVRPLQYREDGTVIEGTWNSGANYYSYTDGHEPGLNWQVSTTYAEDGKRKTVIQYFDGTLRSRQTVTKDNVNNNTIVAETFYDYQGRPAINILPAPTLNTVIEFAKDFNRFTSTNYPKDIYDLLPVGQTVCSSFTPPLNTGYGASNYYSPLNPNKDDGINKYIPDAEGYPYAETIYVPDATGRIAAQGGVGPTFQLNTGHETKYYYGSADQRELDALFGTEVGDSSHYFKNMVRDANGQFSVSYVDMHGRTIATALAGEHPANLDQLENYNSQTLTKNLLTNNIVKDRSIESATTLLVPKGGAHTFHYDLSPESLELAACNGGPTICYDCYYDLQIRITGTCGNDPIIITRKNFSFGNYDTICGNPSPPLVVDTVINLDAGEYNITKILTLSHDAQDWYRDNLFTEHNICRKLIDFYNDLYTIMLDSSNCHMTCETCNAGLGDYTAYRARFLSSQGIDPATTVSFEAEIVASYHEAQANCQAMCEEPESIVSSIRQQMLDDMTPDQGQCALLDDESTSYNIFNKHSLLTGGNGAPFRNPVDQNGVAGHLYPDEFGQYNQQTTPALADQQLTPEEFTQQFGAKWAEALLFYHPEYCKLKIAETDLLESYKWDQKLEEIDTWSAAVAKGYMDGMTSIMSDDPFFTGPGSGIISTEMEGLITVFRTHDGTNYSMWKLALMSVNCLNSADPTCGNSIASAPPYGPNDCSGDLNNAWRIFRSLYMSEKARLVEEYMNGRCGINYTNLGSNYTRRFGDYKSFSTDFGALLQELTDLQTAGDGTAAQNAGDQIFTTQSGQIYDETCSGYIEMWKAKLLACDQIYNSPDRDAILSAITTGMKNVCTHGCDTGHPFGSSTVKPNDGYVPTSFEEVIQSVFDRYHINTTSLCNVYLVDYPQPYDKQTPLSNDIVLEPKDDCLCRRIHELQAEQAQVGFTGTLSEFILYQHGVFIRQTFLEDTLISGCNGTPACNTYDPPLDVPAILNCNTPLKTCIECKEYNALKAQFMTEFPSFSVIHENPATDEEGSQNILFEHFMNNHTGFSKSWLEYLDFEKTCSAYTVDWNCKQLEDVIAAFYIAHPDHGTGSACQDLFTAFFNTTFGTSYTFSQIQELFLKYCGSLPDVCEPVLDCPKFKNIILGFYLYYGQGIATASNCQALFVDYFNNDQHTHYTWDELVALYKEICRAGLDVCSRYSHDHLQQIIDAWNGCHANEWMGSDCLAQWVYYFNNATGDSLQAWQIDSLYAAFNVVLNPCSPPFDCAVLKNMLVNYNNGGAANSCPGLTSPTCEDCFVFYINDRLGTHYSFEQIALMYKKACGSDLLICKSRFVAKDLIDLSATFIKWHADNPGAGPCDSLFTATFDSTYNLSYDFNQIMAVYQLYCGKQPDVCHQEIPLSCGQIDSVLNHFFALYPDPHGYFGNRCDTAFAQFFNQSTGDTLHFQEITYYYWSLCGLRLNVCDTTICDTLQKFLHNYDSLYSGYGLPQQLCRDLFTHLFNKTFAPNSPHSWDDIKRLYDSCGTTLTICPADSAAILLNCNRLAGAKKAFFELTDNRLQDDGGKVITGLFNQYFKTPFTSYDQLTAWVADNCSNVHIDTSSFTSAALNIVGTLDILQDSGTYYVFAVSYYGSLIRLNYGSSLLNIPTVTDLGSLGSIDVGSYTVDIKKDGNKWIGYVPGGISSSKLVKLDFGSSLSNTPTATDLGNIGGLDTPIKITLYKDGNTWYGFVINSGFENNDGSLTRLKFGISLDSIPVGTNLGNIGALKLPSGLFLAKHQLDYYLFITNSGDSTITRLDFGDSLSGIPIGTNLGNPGNNVSNPTDITVVEDKGKIFGFVINEVPGSITRLDFSDITSIPVSSNLGNIGNFNYPGSISQMFRTGEAINFLISNYLSNSISRVSFTDLSDFSNEPSDSVKVVLRTTPVESIPVPTSYPPRLCNSTVLFPPVTVVEPDPCDYVQTLAWNEATEQYNVYLQHQKDDFDKKYQDKCLSAASLETFTVTSEVAEYHYTLYYYDQAGNLVKTVPPAGVQPDFSDAFYHSVEAAKKDGDPVLPNHTLPTQYRYNTLNQVVEQLSPDGGLSKFWYDRLGRLVVSQNAKQAVSGKYSYTKYDQLGRITEVGQLTGAEVTQALTQDQTSLDGWFTDADNTREQITKTVYDLPANICGSPSFLCQANLRNRVSYTMLIDQAAEDYATATYYSYDIHGNVDTLLQHYQKGIMHDITGNAYKKMVYQYDLISGKVNEVAYQPGIADQFYHRYEYDAENKLTDVFTSHDYLYWERQAHYDYYRHGPLARTEIGELGVQGMDYAYTLQGWLKGVNSTTATNAFDIGGDGAVGGRVAKDVYGFSLNYFAHYTDAGSTVHSDYKTISSTVTPFAAIDNGLPQLSSDGVVTGSDLFNGNIRAMLVTIPSVGGPRAYGYRYDQLNRIKAMNAYDSLNLTTNVFTPTALGDYKERITYDPNGNIQTYLRNGATAASGLSMDSLYYQYPKYDNSSGNIALNRAGKIINNRLRYVHDAVSSGSYTEDIDNQTSLSSGDAHAELSTEQSTDNYVYDEIGNLVKDGSEGITGISWTVYGKIASISKTVSGNTTNIYYTYDASGNRISKVVVKGSDSTYTWYVRDASGNVMAVYERGNSQVNNGDLSQTEVDLYGSSRLGLWKANRDVQKENWEIFETTGMGGTDGGQDGGWARGQTVYELSNHLGNVLVTISDKKKGIDVGNDGSIDYYEAVVVTANDYYPFGMMMPGRSFVTPSEAKGYRYGFNGKENDNEVKGEGNEQDYGMRIYDTRVGRFLSIDAITKNYPSLTPYQFASNSPIANVDLDGGESKYYDIELYYKNDSKGKLIPSNKIITDNTSKKTGWFVHGQMYRSHGDLGKGTLYAIYGGTTTETGETITFNKLGYIYVPEPLKPSPDRPVSNMPLEIIVWGSGDDPDESPGSGLNPNKKVITFDKNEFDEIMDPILTAMPESSPGKIEPPSLNDLVKDAGEGGLDKAIEDLKAKWEGENNGNKSPTSPSSTSPTNSPVNTKPNVKNDVTKPTQTTETHKKTFVFVRHDDYGVGPHRERKGSVQDHMYTLDTVISLNRAKDNSGVDTFHIKQLKR